MSTIEIPVDTRLQKSVDEIRNTQQVVTPLQYQGQLPSFPKYTFESHGEVTLVVIPTKNKSKVDEIRRKFETLVDPTKLQFIVIEADSKVGQQPYDDEEGLTGAFNRLTDAFNKLNTPENIKQMGELGIGTIIGASIESFFKLEYVGGKIKSAIDYGAIIVHNATTGSTDSTISEGAPMDPAYIEIAISLGFDDAEKKHGKVTGGKVLAAHVPGLDHADWQGVVTGIPRYTTLRKAMDTMYIRQRLG